jgi:hypothetical protein
MQRSRSEHIALLGREGKSFLPSQASRRERAYCLLRQMRRSEHIALVGRDGESYMKKGESILPYQAEGTRELVPRAEGDWPNQADVEMEHIA